MKSSPAKNKRAYRQPKTSLPSQKKVLRKRSFRGSVWAAIAALSITLATVMTIGWLGVQLIVNPQSVTWINHWIPGWIPAAVIKQKSPQTLQQIRQELEKTGKAPGEMLGLGKNHSFFDRQISVSDRLLPVIERPANCQTDCEKIVELRLYQTDPAQKQEAGQQSLYQLVTQLAIAGPQESFAIAPLVDASSASQGSARLLPLTELKPFDDKLLPSGIWLNLRGQWLQQGNTVTYGNIIHYNPARFHLSPMLEWSSTTGDDPHWQQVTGDKTLELVINQTVGLEPQFKIYQVKPRKFVPNPIQFEPISLSEPALNDQTYQKGLLLARSGLWSIGLRWLQSCKNQNPQQWNSTAQAQMALVQWHAEATKAQAEKSWSSPNQQILASLIDGRWQSALTTFEANPENIFETGDLLRADPGRLQNRVEALLQIDPTQAEAKTWGALLIAAKQGEKAAIAWLKKQPKTPASDVRRITRLVKQLGVSG